MLFTPVRRTGLLLALVLTEALAGCAGYAPIQLADIPQKVEPARQGCGADWMRVRFKNGKQRVGKDGRDEFPVCAITADAIVPCCPAEHSKGGWTAPCDPPERIKFSEIKTAEWRSVGFGRCAGPFSLGRIL